jgi:hypothetical protein
MVNEAHIQANCNQKEADNLMKSWISNDTASRASITTGWFPAFGSVANPERDWTSPTLYLAGGGKRPLSDRGY